MATVNWSVIKAHIYVLLPSLEGVHCQLQLWSMKAIRIIVSGCVIHTVMCRWKA